MPITGLSYLKYALIEKENTTGSPDYKASKSMGKAVSANLVPRTASSPFYADNTLAEQVDEFIDHTVTITNDDWTLEILSDLLGAKLADGGTGLKLNANDKPPHVGVGYIRDATGGLFEAIFLPKAKASLPSFDAETRGENINFKTAPIAFKGFALEDGDWIYIDRFGKYEDAKAFIDLCFDPAAETPPDPTP